MSLVAGTLTHELHNVFIRKRKKDSTGSYQVILENQTSVVTFYKLRDRLLTYCSGFLFFFQNKPPYQTVTKREHRKSANGRIISCKFSSAILIYVPFLIF